MELLKNPLLYHYARLIELMYASERAVQLLEDDSITGTDLRQGLSGELMSKAEAKESGGSKEELE